MPTDCTGRLDRNIKVRSDVQSPSLTGIPYFSKPIMKKNRTMRKKNIPAAYVGTPIRRDKKHRKISLTHSEIFEDFETGGSADGALFSYSVNPNNRSLFPWLSGLAINYERYILRDLEFVFTPRLGTTNTGSVVLAWDPDPDDGLVSITAGAPSVAIRKLMTYDSSCAAAVYERQALKIKQLPTEPLYIRGGQHKANTESRRWTDAGRFYCVTDYGGVAATLGTLVVRYTLDLMQPTFSEENVDWGSDFDEGATLSSTHYISDPDFEGNLLSLVDAPIQYARTFNLESVGKYLLTAVWNGTGVTLGAVPDLVSMSGAIITRVFRMIDPAATNAIAQYLIESFTPDNLITFGAFSGLTTLTSFRMLAGRFNGDYPAPMIVATPKDNTPVPLDDTDKKELQLARAHLIRQWNRRSIGRGNDGVARHT